MTGEDESDTSKELHINRQLLQTILRLGDQSDAGEIYDHNSIFKTMQTLIPHSVPVLLFRRS